MCWAHVLIINSGICDSKLTEFEGRSLRTKFAANCMCFSYHVNLLIYIALMQDNTVKPHAPGVYILYQIGYVMGYSGVCMLTYIPICMPYLQLAVCTINKKPIYSPEHATTSIEMGTKLDESILQPYPQLYQILTIFGHLICMHA